MAESPRQPTFAKPRSVEPRSAAFQCSGTALGAIQAEPLVPLNPAELQALLRRTRPLVQPADYRVLEGMVQTALYKEELLERRELAIHRLLRLAEASKLSTAKNSSAWQRAGRHADFVERP